jgi:hypothetical protein
VCCPHIETPGKRFISKWLIELTSDFYMNDTKINTLLYADNQIMKTTNREVRGPFEKLLDWRQCAAVMQREAVTKYYTKLYWGGGVT